MSRRSLARVIVLALIVAVSGSAVAAWAQAPPNAARLDMVVGKNSFKANRYFQVGLRFSKDVVTIRSGGTLSVRNRTPGEPHSLSFVPRSKIPKTAKAVSNCGAPKTICAQLGVAHEIDKQGNPTKPVVDVGAPGIDTASTGGDSYVFAPKGKKGSTMKIKVSAPAGATLSFMCGFHPWMQGVLKVG